MNPEVRLFEDRVLLIDKPAGETSFETMKKVQRAAGVKKAGHCGTLDRFASGLLVITTGKASKIARFLLDSDKRYRAMIELGLSSPSHDPETEMGRVPVPDGAFDRLDEILKSFEGKQNQTPPEYSALKIQGKRASDRVRAGEKVEMKSRPVTVYSLQLLSVDRERNLIEADIACSKGTYIRSLARDIGHSLGTEAVLKSLVRTSSGSFSLDDSVTVPELIAGAEGSYAITIEKALAHMTRIEVSGSAAEKIANGAVFPRDEIISVSRQNSEASMLVYGTSVCAVALVDMDSWAVKYLTVFN